MQETLSLIRAFLGEMGGQLAPEKSVEEEIFRVAPAEPRMVPSQFYEIPAKPSRTMGLQLFQTGKTQTFLIGKIAIDNDVRPVHYANAASAVLSRIDRQLAPYTRPLTAHLILLDLDGLDADSEIIERYREGIEILDTHPADTGYKTRRLAAIQQAARVRREMTEEGLITLKEGREPGVIIVLDGSLSGIEGAVNMPGVIGIVSADSDVIGGESSILECPFGARSGLDQVGSPPAFYMRLRDPVGKNPDYGLIRVELGLNPDGGKPDEIWASDIASLVFKERFPVDRSMTNWDKSIFTLKHAGKYIDTLLPSPGLVTTYFGRSGS